MKRECWKELALVMWHIVTFPCIAGDADQTWSSCCNWDHVQFVPIFRLVPDSVLFVFFFSLTPETLWVIYLTHFMLMGKYMRCNRPPFFICVLHHSVLLWSYKPRTRGVDVVGMFFSLPVVLGVWTAGSWVWWLLLAFELLSHLKMRAGEGVTWALSADLYWEVEHWHKNSNPCQHPEDFIL